MYNSVTVTAKPVRTVVFGVPNAIPVLPQFELNVVTRAMEFLLKVDEPLLRLERIGSATPCLSFLILLGSFVAMSIVVIFLSVVEARMTSRLFLGASTTTSNSLAHISIILTFLSWSLAWCELSR